VLEFVTDGSHHAVAVAVRVDDNAQDATGASHVNAVDQARPDAELALSSLDVDEAVGRLDLADEPSKRFGKGRRLREESGDQRVVRPYVRHRRDRLCLCPARRQRRHQDGCGTE